MVDHALQSGTLVLVKDGAGYALSGHCPRCQDLLTPQVIELDVLLPDRFGGLRTDAGANLVEVEIVCNCDTEHKKSSQGCGFGKGLLVSITRPVAT
jgi:hypothetical protein